jgi:hypothetical protein
LLIYAGYSPSVHEAEMVAWAFEAGKKAGAKLSKTHSTSRDPNQLEQAESN